MNERIRELQEQAGWPKDTHQDDMYQVVSPDFAKKFAELIVAECVKILVTGEGNENTSDAVWDLEELGVDVSKILNTIRS